MHAGRNVPGPRYSRGLPCITACAIDRRSASVANSNSHCFGSMLKLAGGNSVANIRNLVQISLDNMKAVDAMASCTQHGLQLANSEGAF